jgi:predicted oxidoreductase
LGRGYLDRTRSKSRSLGRGIQTAKKWWPRPVEMGEPTTITPAPSGKRIPRFLKRWSTGLGVAETFVEGLKPSGSSSHFVGFGQTYGQISQVLFKSPRDPCGFKRSSTGLGVAYKSVEGVE